MAITTDSYYDIINAGVTLDRIGLSKTLDNYTIDEIKEMTFCGATEDKVRYMGKGLAVGSNYTMVAYTQNISGGCPYIARYIGGQYQYPQLDIGGTDEYNYPDGLNHTVVWLYRSSGTYDGIITSANQSNYNIITEWDAPKYTMYITYDNSKSNIFLIQDNISVVYNTNRGNAGNVQVNAIGVPYILFEHDGKVFFMHAFYFTLLETTAFTYINNSNNSSCMCAFRSYTDSEEYGSAVTMADLCNGDNLDNPATLPAQVSVVDYYNYTGHTMVDGVAAYVTVGSNTGLGVRGISMRYFYSKIENMLLNIAGAGLYFNVGNTEYKPIISSGWVIDYTDDLGRTSDIDGWSGSTKHTVPPSPPGPTPPGDDDDNTDPISTADAPFGAGIAHYYAMTADSVLLQHVSEALGTWDIDTSKKDLYRNLISCKLVKPPAPIPVSGSEDFTIYGVVPQYQGAGVKLPVINGNPSNTFGPYTITRKFNDFRDFAPYSKAEIFLPYCGWTALPSHVIGRSVTVKYFTDIIAATCKAVVFCNNNVVAEAAGIIGLDIPFAAENVGAKMEAANMGLLSSTLGAVQTAVGVGTMVSTKSGSGMKNVTSGLSQVISGCTQISMAGNENWTEINGKAGDGCSLSGITNIIIKITRPKYGSFSSPPYVPSGYAHNVGFVAMKQTKPGNVSGLLVCDNVDTSGISGATQRERELIKAYLESGIIVNAAPSP